MAESWSAEIVDRDGAVLGRLPRIRGGQLDWNAHAAVQLGGSIELDEAPGLDIDWTTSRIQILHHDNGTTRPMGVYRPSWPSRTVTPARTGYTLRLEDPTARLRGQIGYWAHHNAGQTVTDRIARNLRELGERLIALTPSAETLRAPLTWDPDRTWGTMIADLLDAIGHTNIWCDLRGWWRTQPYVPPQQRPVAATYGGQPDDYLCRTVYGDSADIADTPNRVLLWTDATPDAPALVSEAWLSDTLSPFHPDKVGSWTRSERVEASSQAVLDAKARRLLAEGLETVRTVSWTHPVDDTVLGDRVHIRRLGVDAVITRRSIELGIGAVCHTEARRIYTGGQLW